MRRQEYDFFAWLHTAALGHLVGLERMEILQLLTVSCTLAQNIRLALHRCGRRLLGRHILEHRIRRLGVLAITCMLLENQFRVDPELALMKKTNLLRSVPEMRHVLILSAVRCMGPMAPRTVGFLETLTLICKDRFPHLTSFLGYRRDLVVPLVDSS